MSIKEILFQITHATSQPYDPRCVYRQYRCGLRVWQTDLYAKERVDPFRIAADVRSVAMTSFSSAEDGYGSVSTIMHITQGST